MAGVEAWVLHLVGSPWTFVAVAVVLALGGVVTVLPSQSLVVAVGALLVARMDPASLVLLGLATAAGMLGGDLGVYGLTRAARAVEHRERRRKALRPHLLPRLIAPIEGRIRAMRTRFAHAPLRTLVIGRFVPTGRAATDVLAGDAALPLLRFVRYSAVAGAGYAAFCIALAALAGPLVRHAPLVVTAGAIVVSILVGVVVDRVDARLHATRHPA